MIAEVMHNPRFAAAHPVRTWEMSRLHKKWRTEVETFCQWCGTVKTLEVHDIIPLFIDENGALDKGNKITLCRKCHWIVGHLRHFAKRYVPNIRNLCRIRQFKERGR